MSFLDSYLVSKSVALVVGLVLGSWLACQKSMKIDPESYLPGKVWLYESLVARLVKKQHSFLINFLLIYHHSLKTSWEFSRKSRDIFCSFP